MSSIEWENQARHLAKPSLEIRVSRGSWKPSTAQQDATQAINAPWSGETVLVE